jgi:hypothetical protein
MGNTHYVKVVDPVPAFRVGGGLGRHYRVGGFRRGNRGFRKKQKEKDGDGKNLGFYIFFSNHAYKVIFGHYVITCFL